MDPLLRGKVIDYAWSQKDYFDKDNIGYLKMNPSQFKITGRQIYHMLGAACYYYRNEMDYDKYLSCYYLGQDNCPHMFKKQEENKAYLLYVNQYASMQFVMTMVVQRYGHTMKEYMMQVKGPRFLKLMLFYKDEINEQYKSKPKLQLLGGGPKQKHINIDKFLSIPERNKYGEVIYNWLVEAKMYKGYEKPITSLMLDEKSNYVGKVMTNEKYFWEEASRFWNILLNPPEKEIVKPKTQPATQPIITPSEIDLIGPNNDKSLHNDERPQYGNILYEKLVTDKKFYLLTEYASKIVGIMLDTDKEYVIRLTQDNEEFDKMVYDTYNQLVLHNTKHSDKALLSQDIIDINSVCENIILYAEKEVLKEEDMLKTTFLSHNINSVEPPAQETDDEDDLISTTTIKIQQPKQLFPTFKKNEIMFKKHSYVPVDKSFDDEIKRDENAITVVRAKPKFTYYITKPIERRPEIQMKHAHMTVTSTYSIIEYNSQVCETTFHSQVKGTYNTSSQALAAEYPAYFKYDAKHVTTNVHEALALFRKYCEFKNADEECIFIETSNRYLRRVIDVGGSVRMLLQGLAVLLLAPLKSKNDRSRTTGRLKAAAMLTDIGKNARSTISPLDLLEFLATGPPEDFELFNFTDVLYYIPIEDLLYLAICLPDVYIDKVMAVYTMHLPKAAEGDISYGGVKMGHYTYYDKKMKMKVLGNNYLYQHKHDYTFLLDMDVCQLNGRCNCKRSTCMDCRLTQKGLFLQMEVTERFDLTGTQYIRGKLILTTINEPEVIREPDYTNNELQPADAPAIAKIIFDYANSKKYH
jgi:hypothetical protein